MADYAKIENLRDLRAVVYRDLFRGTFRGLTLEEWKKLLDAAKSVQADAGEVVLQQAVAGQGIFVVAEGSVRVERVEPGTGDPVRLATLGAGEVFGEMSFLEDTETSARVVAEETSELLHIDGDRITAILEVDVGFAAGFYRSLAVALSYRLRTTNYLV